jgi:uncharacterized protein HemY
MTIEEMYIFWFTIILVGFGLLQTWYKDQDKDRREYKIQVIGVLVVATIVSIIIYLTINHREGLI